MSSFLFPVGLLLAFFGFCVTLAFWVPRIFNREQLHEILGSRYPLIYVIYIANGPLLLLLGLYIIFVYL